MLQEWFLFFFWRVLHARFFRALFIESHFLIPFFFFLFLLKKDGVTPLYVAAQNKHLEVVQFLLDKGANLNALNKVFFIFFIFFFGIIFFFLRLTFFFESKFFFFFFF